MVSKLTNHHHSNFYSHENYQSRGTHLKIILNSGRCIPQVFVNWSPGYPSDSQQRTPKSKLGKSLYVAAPTTSPPTGPRRTQDLTVRCIAEPKRYLCNGSTGRLVTPDESVRARVRIQNQILNRHCTACTGRRLFLVYIIIAGWLTCCTCYIRLAHQLLTTTPH